MSIPNPTKLNAARIAKNSLGKSAVSSGAMARMNTMPIILAPFVSSVEDTSSLMGYVNSTAASVMTGQ